MTQSSRSAPVGVILAVDPGRFAEVVEALRRAGLTVTGEQAALGTLSGTVAENRIPALETVDGVESVDRERIIQLPRPTPPSSKSRSLRNALGLSPERLSPGRTTSSGRERPCLHRRECPCL